MPQAVDMDLHPKEATLQIILDIRLLEPWDKVTQHMVPEKKVHPNVKIEL